MEEDKRLYKEFLDGNNKAFNTIISKYEKNLIYFITRYVKDIDIAQDIYQDTVMYLLEHKEKYDDKYSLKAYLYLIAKSRAINYLNSKKRNVPIENYENSLQEEKLLEDIIFSKERQKKIEIVLILLKQMMEEHAFIDIPPLLPKVIL